jgi:hypothetical protein
VNRANQSGARPQANCIASLADDCLTAARQSSSVCRFGTRLSRFTPL